jgi:hypothetical protein
MIRYAILRNNNVINKRLFETFMTDKYSLSYNSEEAEDYIFNENYFANIQFDGDMPMIYSSYYNKEKRQLEVYKTTIVCKKVMDYNVKKMVINFEKESTSKVLSLISTTKGDIISYAITYEDNYFELIMVNLKYRYYKSKAIHNIGKTSGQILGNFHEKSRIITDIFISSNLLIAIFNFRYLIMIDIESFELIPNAYKQEFRNLFILDLVFGESTNKCLYVLPVSGEEVDKTKVIEDVENDDIEEDLRTNVGGKSIQKIDFYIITKNQTRSIKSILKSKHTESVLSKLLKLVNDRVTNFLSKNVFKFENFATSNKDIGLYMKYLWLLYSSGEHSYDFLLNLYKANFKLLIQISKNDDLLPFALMKDKSILNHASSFQTYKFEYFGNLNLTHFNKIEISNNFITNVIPTEITSSNFPQLRLKKQLVCCSVTNSFTDSPIIYNVSVHNYPYSDYYIYFILKNLIERKFNQYTVDYIMCTLKGGVPGSGDRELILNWSKDYIKILSHVNSSRDETRVEQDSCLLLTKLKKHFKVGNLSAIFTELKRIYTNSDSSKIIMFIIYLITYYSKKGGKSYTFYKQSTFDLIRDLNDGVDITAIKDKHLRKPFSGCSLTIKDELNNIYLLIVLNIFLNNREDVYTLINRVPDRLRAIYFLNNLLDTLRKGSGSTLINLSLGGLGNLNLLSDISKYLVNSSILLLEGNSNERLRNILILLNMKVEIKRYKKIVVDKSINILFNCLSTSFNRGVNVLKNGEKLDDGPDIPEELSKGVFEHDITYWRLYLNWVNRLANKRGTCQEIRDSLIIVNYTLRKNKHKNKLRSFLNNQQHNDIKDKVYHKYSNLISNIRNTIFYIYLSINIFRLNAIMRSGVNHVEKTNTVLKIFMLISFYYSIKYPDRSAIFRDEIIEIFSQLVSKSNDQDLVETFFAFIDIDMTSCENNSIRDLLEKIKKDSPIYNEKLMKTVRLRRNVTDISGMIEYMSSNNESYKQFCYFIYEELFDSNLLGKDIINDIKVKRKVVKKEAEKIFCYLDNIVSFSGLFSTNKETGMYKPPKVVDKINNGLLLSTRRILKETLQKVMDEDKEADVDEDKITVRNEYNLQINQELKEQLFSGSDYSIDNISNISNLSGINKPGIKPQYNTIPHIKENEFILQQEDDEHLPQFKSTIGESSKYNKLRDGMYCDNSDSFYLHDKSSLSEQSRTINRYDEMSYDITNYQFFTNDNKINRGKLDIGVKKKYIGLKLFISVFNKKVKFYKTFFIKYLRYVGNRKVEDRGNNNVSTVEANTQTDNMGTRKGKTRMKLLGKSIYPILNGKNENVYLKK